MRKTGKYEGLPPPRLGEGPVAPHVAPPRLFERNSTPRRPKGGPKLTRAPLTVGVLSLLFLAFFDAFFCASLSFPLYKGSLPEPFAGRVAGWSASTLAPRLAPHPILASPATR